MVLLFTENMTVGKHVAYRDMRHQHYFEKIFRRMLSDILLVMRARKVSVRLSRLSVKLVAGAALLIITVVVIARVYEARRYPSLDMSNAVAETLTFSNTGKWAFEFWSLAARPLTTAVHLSDISLPPPPANDSLETRAEIAAMLRMKADERTTATVDAIVSEAGTTTIWFTDHRFAEYFSPTSTLPEVAVLAYAWEDLSTLIMTEKKQFDRPRPNVLKAAIDPVIDVPHHPAYPSGHSAQAHFLAYILGELHPESRDAYITRADEIAHHREVAGLHYPSDSAAGALLAQQYFDALHTDPTFLKLMEEAKRKIAKK